jgi:hypothetical protein
MNTLEPVYQQQIVVSDSVNPIIGAALLVSPYQSEDGTHLIEIDVNITEPEMASGVDDGWVWIEYYNTTIGFNPISIYSFIKDGTTYKFFIPNQLPTENVTIRFHARDIAHNNVYSSPTTFSVGLWAQRGFRETLMIQLRDLSGIPLANVSIDAITSCYIQINPYAILAGGATDPAYQTIGGYYQIFTNITPINIIKLTVILYYSQSVIDAQDRNESTAVLGIHNGTGYVENLQSTSVNLVDNYVTLTLDTNLAQLYYFTVLCKEASPNPVSNLQIEVYIGANEIYLTWDPNAESDLAVYNIYKSTSAGFLPGVSNYIGNTTNTYFDDTNLIEGTIYFYIVLAVDLSQLKSGFIQRVNGTPTNSVGLGQTITIYPNRDISLSFAAVDMILQFTATGQFDLQVNSLTTSYAFTDYKLLMAFYINITTIGSPGTVLGTITLTIDTALLEGVDTANIAIYYWDGDSWEPLNSVYHASNHSITATLTHFSIFGAFGPVLKGGFPLWLIFVAIGGVAGVAVVVLARRKKVIPTDQLIEQINNRGHVRLDELASEYKMDHSRLIELITEAIGTHKLSGFFSNKKKEFITIFHLKKELNKRLEEGE